MFGVLFSWGLKRNRFCNDWHKNFCHFFFRCKSDIKPNPILTCSHTFFYILNFDCFIGEQGWHWEAGMAQWWERSPPTNVSRVRFPDLASYVGWVCWFSLLLREVFLRELRFSPLLKNQHLIWFELFDLSIWFDLFNLQSPQLVEHSCSVRMIWDLKLLLLLLSLDCLCPLGLASESDYF